MAEFGQSNTSLLWLIRFMNFQGADSRLQILIGAAEDRTVRPAAGKTNYLTRFFKGATGLEAPTFTIENSQIVLADTVNPYSTTGLIVFRPLSIDNLGFGEQKTFRAVNGRFEGDYPTDMYDIGTRKIMMPVDTLYDSNASITKVLRICQRHDIRMDWNLYGLDTNGLFKMGYFWCGCRLGSSNDGESSDNRERKQSELSFNVTPSAVYELSPPAYAEDTDAVQAMYSAAIYHNKVPTNTWDPVPDPLPQRAPPPTSP